MPLSSRTFSQLIDFTRTSAATFVNSSGNIASTPQSRNLLTFTNEFANAAWTKSNAQIVPNVNPAAASLGSELVTNGGFASDTVWTKGAGWSIAAGVATRVAAGSGGILSQAITVVAGRLYAVTYTISGFSAGSINSSFSGGTTVNGATRSANGTYTEYLVAASGNTTFELVCGSASAAMSIDNVSVREVVGGALQAPDGTFTADTVIATASSSIALNQSAVVNATAATFSIYAKQGSSATAANTFRLRNSTTSTTLVEVTLNYSTGAITYTTGSTGASATSVGNGWWRVVITATSGISSGNTLRVDAGFSGTGATNDYCFLWGAQLEQASAATDYTRNFGGLFPPRFDYDPVTRAPRGLLIEEQRTNLLTGSADFTATYWPTATNVVVTADNSISPDGTNNADRLADNTTPSVQHRIYRDYTFSAGAHTLSVYAKRDDHRWFRLFFFDGTTNFFANFDLLNGAVGNKHASATSSITSAGNGWFRCTLTATAAAAAGNIQMVMLQTDDAGVPSLYTGTGTSLWLYGAQLEAGAFATSYIPTVASQVTRTADVAAINAPNFASWYNQTAGSFLVEALTFKPTTSASVSEATSANDGTTNNRITTRFASSTADGVVVASGSTVAAISTSYTAGVAAKIALASAANDFALAVNGALIGTDTSGAMPTVNKLDIGNLTGFNFLNGHIRSIRYYPTRLSNAQLQALTA